jgi:predicted nuclease with TOPRIM domain
MENEELCRLTFEVTRLQRRNERLEDMLIETFRLLSPVVRSAVAVGELVQTNREPKDIPDHVQSEIATRSTDCVMGLINIAKPMAPIAMEMLTIVRARKAKAATEPGAMQ